MKKTGAAVFELIHSLTMAEKKYFKMFSSLQGGDKNYLKLYDAIEKQRSYNENALHRACRGQKFLQYLSVANRHLRNNILRSLEIYHHSIDINLRSKLNKAEILLRKGLTAQALQLLKQAKPIAYEHERWELLMELLVMEKTPYSAMELLKMPLMNEEREAVFKKINNINDYQIIHHKITYKIQETGPMRTKKELSRVEKLMQHPLLHNSKQAFCAEAKAYYYEIHSLYYYFKRDIIQGYHTSKEQCDFIETHLHQLKDPEKKHLVALNSLVTFIGYLVSALAETNTRRSYQINRKMYDEMQEALQKIRAYSIASNTLKATFWFSSYVNELNMFLLIGDFEKVFPAIKAIEENENMVSQIPAATRNILYYNIAYLLFGAGSYDEALFWLRKIMDQPANELRKDMQASARILYLLLHYELHKDEQLLDSLERSAMNFLSTRQRLFKVEKALLHCLRQIMGKLINTKERNAALQAFQTTLLKLMKNPMEKAAMEDFDFLSWVESKIQNKTFAEVARGKAIFSIRDK